jgi:DNA (cytosine-5)-methyltransferase 1
MMRPRLLDLYCAAGGASMGFHRAGFDVVGVDIAPQPHYPFEFHQGDAVEFLIERWREFDAVHASPPCFLNSTLKTRLPSEHGHVDLIPRTRLYLRSTGLPYVIENVPGAALIDPIVLCGSMFGLGSGDYYLKRHRLFESNQELHLPGSCRHVGYAIGVHGGGGVRRTTTVRGGYQGTKAERMEAMGIDWMSYDELSLAIPPAYAEHIGHQLLASLGEVAA